MSSRLILHEEDHVDRGQVYLNNKPYYQRLVLDQGYWVEGLYTVTSVEELKKDVELTKAMGFNGARKHQKIEDPYFYYYCDKLGLLFGLRCLPATNMMWPELRPPPGVDRGSHAGSESPLHHSLGAHQ